MQLKTEVTTPEGHHVVDNAFLAGSRWHAVWRVATAAGPDSQPSQVLARIHGLRCRLLARARWWRIDPSFIHRIVGLAANLMEPLGADHYSELVSEVVESLDYAFDDFYQRRHGVVGLAGELIARGQQAAYDAVAAEYEPVGDDLEAFACGVCRLMTLVFPSEAGRAEQWSVLDYRDTAEGTDEATPPGCMEVITWSVDVEGTPWYEYLQAWDAGD